MNADDKALSIAARIADGSAIDWTNAGASPADADPALVEELRAIASLAALHRAPPDWPDATGPPVTQWGSLTLLAPIGEGLFGRVYRAWDPRLHRQVALKLLHAPAAEATNAPTHAIEEARLLARVRHPNVLTVYGAESIDGQVGIWTEFIDGHTLDHVLADRGPLPADEVVAIGIDLCRALSAVHAAGLLHRDIKAQNVMRETGGRIVLMDFGTGHDVEAVPSRSGDLSGTPLYLAPEIFAGVSHTVASDIYALAVLLCRLLTGRFPVEGRTFDDVRAGHSSAGGRALRGWHAEVPPALARAIERGLSVDPAARFGSAGAFELALAGAIPATTVTERPAQLSGHRRALYVGAALFTITVGTIAWMTDARDARTRWFGPGGKVPAAGVASLTDRKLPLPRAVLVGRPSRDGRHLPYVDQLGDLWIWDVETGDARQVTRKPAGVQESAAAAAVSPDGRRVAYMWWTTAQAYELRVVNADGSAARAILGADAADVPEPVEWSHDGRQIVCLLRQRDGSTQIALVPVDGGLATILHAVRTGRPRHASLSQDGRFVVYDVPRDRTSAQRDLWISATDGSAPRRLLGDAANNLMAHWTPDGAGVFFVSDRSGSMHGWVVPVTNGVTAGEPIFVARDLDRVAALGLTATGAFFYNRQTNFQDVYTVPIDVAGNARPGTPARVSTVVGGHIGPGWSPDGQWISYVTAGGGTALDRDSNTLTIQHVRSGRTRDLPLALSRLGVAAPRWSPDSRRLLVRGDDENSRTGYFSVDVASGTATAIVTWEESQDAAYGGFHWSQDGRSIVYIHRPRGIIARDVTSGGERVLVANGGRDIRSFDISRDSGSLAFTGVIGQGAERASVLEIQPPGGAPHELFRVSGPEWVIVHAWTPGDTHVLVTRLTPGSREPQSVLTIAIAGGESRDLGIAIRGMTQTNRLALSPDGRSLAYTEGTVSWESWVIEGFLPPAAAGAIGR